MEKCMSKAKVKSIMKPQAESSGTGKVNVNMKVKNIKPKSIVKSAVYKDKQTRNEIFQIISENTNLNKTQIEGVFDELNKLIEGHLKKRGSGEFVIPKAGVKLRRIKKKPTKERRMLSPLTGQEVTIAAKPARLSVKLTALKILKEAVDKQ